MPIREIKNWRSLNKESQSYDCLADELQDMENMKTGLRGELEPRTGVSDYELVFGGTTVNGGHRFAQSDGSVEMVAYSNGNIYEDNGAGTFNVLVAFTASADNFVRFRQYRDTMIAFSDNDDPKAYHQGITNPTRDLDIGHVFTLATLVQQVAGSATWAIGDWITYRFCFIVRMGNDLMSVSHPLQGPPAPVNYFEQQIQIAGAATNQVQIVKSGAATVPQNVEKIMIYRHADYTIRPSTASPVENFFYVGEITQAAYDAAGAGVVLFSDNSVTADLRQPQTIDTADVGQGQISYIGQIDPVTGAGMAPRGRFGAVHKNRLWIGTTDNFIAYSELTQPEKFQADARFALADSRGEPFTAIESFQGRNLLVCTANATFGIFGGDVEGLGGLLDIDIQTLDAATGCIAPATMADAEGLKIWLSNKGPYYYDGTVPKPLGADEILPVLEAIPAARRYYAAGAYYSKRRQYWLAVTPSGGSGNTEVYVYDFRRKGWTGPNKYQDAPGDTPYNLFVEFRRGDEAGLLLGLTNNHPTGSSFHNLDSTPSEFGSNIPWYARTAAIDFGPYVARIKAIAVELNVAVTTTIQWTLDDDATRQGSFTIPSTAGVQKLVVHDMGNRECNRLDLKVSGSSQVSGQVIKRFLVEYENTGRFKLNG